MEDVDDANATTKIMMSSSWRVVGGAVGGIEYWSGEHDCYWYCCRCCLNLNHYDYEHDAYSVDAKDIDIAM